MALTKANASHLSAVTTSQTSTATDISGAYACDLEVSIAQVGTASSAATWKPQWSPDGGTTYYDGPTFSAGTAAATYYWTVAVPATMGKVKVAFTAQSGGTSSTCTAQQSTITAV